MAAINAERGGDVVAAHLADAAISAVNYSEVLKKTIERDTPTDPVIAFIAGWPIEIVPFDERLAGWTAELYPQVKQIGLSMADRACLALGIQRNCKVLTAERRMALVSLPIKVKLIRNAH